MKRIQTITAVILVISAAAGYFLLKNDALPSAPSQPATNSPVVITAALPITATPTYEGCSFMWATHDNPELAKIFDEAVQPVIPNADVRAESFGEDCTYADGHSTFSVMTNDLFIRLPVNDLSAGEEFGNTIKQVLDMVTNFPKEKIKPGIDFVEFSFFNGEEQVLLRVNVNEYLNNAGGVGGTELFQKFYTPLPPLVTLAAPTPTITLTPKP